MRVFPVLVAFLVLACESFSQGVENVLVVMNEASAVSLAVGEYYSDKRGVPESNRLRIRASAEENIARAAYEREIETPIAAWISRNSAHDRILYIVLTKGIPLRITGTSGQDGTVASVDSDLTLLYRKMAGQTVVPNGRIANPAFVGDISLARARPFTHEILDIYLVTRLDGFSLEDVRGLIDRAVAPSREGKIVLDGKGGAQDRGEMWLRSAANALKAAGMSERTVLDATAMAVSGLDAVLGYCSWGSNDPAASSRRLGLSFVPGALAALFVSSDARTFAEPPADWKIGTWEDKSSHYAGSPQTLTGDLIREGVTGIAGTVAEPYLEATIRPDILFPAYLDGLNLAESFYAAMPFVSWQTVVIGDPLCAPFRSEPMAASEIDPGIDESTELPKHFSARRLRNLSVAAYRQGSVHPDTVRLLLRAEVRLAKQDPVEARRLLEEATSRDSRIVAAQLLLALLYEQDSEHDKAIERYRRVLELTPQNAVVQNYLAYALAVHKNSLREALPLAEKAYGLAKGNPNIADTLGWIHHLTGNDATAAGFLEEAARAAGTNPEVLIHAAVVYAILGRTEDASQALSRAVAADPSLEARDDVRSLRSKLGKQ